MADKLHDAVYSEKRSREFGIYLLLGMEKRQIAKLYMRESVLLGAGAFLAGLVFGVLVLVIYLFYMGLSAWIVIYVRRGGNAIYKAQTLFLLRQFASRWQNTGKFKEIIR